MTIEHPSPERERAARAWRDAKDAREEWRAFKKWLARTKPDDDTSDAPYWTDGFPSNHRLWTPPSPRGVLFFEKAAIMDAFLPDGRGSDRATRLGIATSVTPYAPSPFDQKRERREGRMPCLSRRDAGHSHSANFGTSAMNARHEGEEMERMPLLQ